MSRPREAEIIAEEICARVPGIIRYRGDDSPYLDLDDCRAVATIIINRLHMHRSGTAIA